MWHWFDVKHATDALLLVTWGLWYFLQVILYLYTLKQKLTYFSRLMMSNVFSYCCQLLFRISLTLYVCCNFDVWHVLLLLNNWCIKTISWGTQLLHLCVHEKFNLVHLNVFLFLFFSGGKVKDCVCVTHKLLQHTMLCVQKCVVLVNHLFSRQSIVSVSTWVIKPLLPKYLSK